METNKQTPERPHESNRFIIGILLVIAGFILILEKTTVLPGPLDYFIDNIIFSWQMLLIVIGIITMTGSGNKTPGIVLIAVGGFFLIPELFTDYFESFNFFWPALFIVIGVVMLINSRRLGDSIKTWSTDSKADMIDYVNVFSGAERQLITDNFMGGKVTSVFGGGEVDLTRSSLQPGNSVIEITCIFGGTTIIVPESWNVIIDVTPILGGFSDGRRLSGEVLKDTTKSLTIRGLIIFGGGEIKCHK